MALGVDGRLFLLALEGPHADVLLDAAARAREATGVPPREIGVAVPAAADPAVARDVTARGFRLALAVDDADRERFTLARGDAFAGPVEALRPDLTLARVRWSPDDAPEAKKAQALALTRLGAWLHETDRALLIDLRVVPADGAAAADDTLGAIREIRDLGIEADLWAVAGTADPADAEALGTLVRDAGRHRVAALVRLPSVDDEVLRTCAAADAYGGVLLDGLGDLDAGRSRADLVRAAADRIAATIDLYTAAQPA